MHNNSKGKKQQVEDHRRNFKFSNNKTSVTACNDSLNAKTSNVNFVCVICGKCVLNDNYDMYVLHYINGINSRTKMPIADYVVVVYPIGGSFVYRLGKGVVRFGKKGKLAPRFVGPFEIIEKVGPVAYQLDLPEELNGVHDTFHVSNLKKCLDDPTLQVPLDEIQVDAKLNFVEEPVEILEREFKSLSKVELPSSRFGGIRNVDLNSRGNVRIR
ncbi:hypothetical protein Tco_0315561 [Tanacetum coccineum]